MSQFRDAKVIRSIAEYENCNEVSEEACRYILCSAELFLRQVLSELVKVAKRFNRTRMKPSDISLVLEDMNLEFLKSGVSKDVPNLFVRGENSGFELEQGCVFIKENLIEILKNKLVPKNKIEVNFDWFFVEGTLNPNLSVLQTQPAQSIEGINNALPESQRPDNKFKEFSEFDFLTERNDKNVYLIKEVSPNVLTKESSNFFETYREILAEYFEKIDQNTDSTDYRKFVYSKLRSSGNHQNSSQSPGSCAAFYFSILPVFCKLIRTNLCSTASSRRT